MATSLCSLEEVTTNCHWQLIIWKTLILIAHVTSSVNFPIEITFQFPLWLELCLYKRRRSMIKSTMTSSDYWYIPFESVFQCCLLSWCVHRINWIFSVEVIIQLPIDEGSCLNTMQQTKEVFILPSSQFRLLSASV